MDITSHLLIAENTHTAHSDPHATGVIEIPLDQIDQHPRLMEVYQALSPEDRAECAAEGRLTLTTDYGFMEEYKDGVGLVMRDVNIDVARLRADDKQAIAGWLGEAYAVQAQDDSALSAALHDPQIKQHLVADMTIAGMGKETFLEALAAHAKGEELPYPLETQDVERIQSSLQQRNAEPEQHYDTVAMAMRENWPSPKTKNYGYNQVGEAQVIFFRGFEAASETVIKAGPYAKQPVWPDYSQGFDYYDENGIARDENGGRVAATRIEPDKDYSYFADKAISQSLSGKEAMEAIDRWSATHLDSPTYNGMDRNCVGVAGKVVFGNRYQDMIQALTGKNSPDGQTPKVTNAELREGINAGRQLPEGMVATHVEGINHQTVNRLDSQGIGAALQQISTRSAVQHELKAEQKTGQKTGQKTELAPVAPSTPPIAENMLSALAAVREAGIHIPASYRGASDVSVAAATRYAGNAPTAQERGR